MNFKNKLEEIKKGFEATKEYVLHPIAALFSSKKLQTTQSLHNILETNQQKSPNKHFMSMSEQEWVLCM